jgi:hypothetical protein
MSDKSDNEIGAEDYLENLTKLFISWCVFLKLRFSKSGYLEGCLYRNLSFTLLFLFMEVMTEFVNTNYKNYFHTKNEWDFYTYRGKEIITRNGGAWGDRRYISISFLNSALEGGEWSASHPGRTLPPGKVSSVPIVQEAGWAPEPVWAQRLENKIPCLCRGSKPDRPVRSLTRYWLCEILG